MPTQQKRRSQEVEEGTIDDTGRRHDTHGRFTSTDEEAENGNGRARNGSSGDLGAAGATEAAARGGENSNGNRAAASSRSAAAPASSNSSGISTASGNSQGSSRSSRASSGGTKSIISRAVRELNEIENRIAELRKELEEQDAHTNEGRAGSATVGSAARRGKNTQNGRGASHEADEGEQA